ncbi:MAG: hypothetical protein CO113_15150 [Elusimicrobia bacterium CG_4_9_14_3_um_filter_62_55]|nr:MAG: hypothetical protein COR54_07110 [Elusimicrobia bacterium CG22_combo_CG10-13_8_21_14_all_63_91]PJA18169.1 MAG: hypothetical protein COX66_01930 [Elusimicrobia bacterium CG_4_10_14_0_2_um_filter_63_34]PJB24182.1 MAG: hypothetical protein CO113_15150 [Elusimicrobia bacterium CG_4_9_14_3_um_filter_62_55]
MRWSALRKKYLEFVAPSLKGRIDVHASAYRHSSVDWGRAWISLDKRDIFSVNSGREWDHPWGDFLGAGLGDWLYDYIDRSIEQILASENPIIRGLGMLDRRLGKKRLKEVSRPEHPFVHAMCILRREAEGIQNFDKSEVLTIGATRLAKRRRRARKTQWRSSLGHWTVAAAVLASHNRGENTRRFAQVLRRGAAPGLPPAPPLARVIIDAVRSAEKPEKLARDLEILTKRSKIFTHPQYARGVINLHRRKEEWRAAVGSWKPPKKSAREQFSALARYLFAAKDIPRFMDSAWTLGEDFEFDLFVHLSRTGRIHDAPRLPFSLSKRERHFFMEAPDDYSIRGALRRAQVLAQGGDERVARGLLGTRFEFHFENHEFWETVIAFFIRHPNLDARYYGQITDYIQDQRFARHAALGEQRAAVEQPNLTMRGRRPGELLRDVSRWRRRVIAALEASGECWRSSGFPGYDAVEESENEGSPQQWRIRELLTGEELAEEGSVLNHCVASYGHRCAAGVVSIWSLEAGCVDIYEKRLTLEVRNKSFAVVQARGSCNRVPSDEELEHVIRWCEEAGLVYRASPDV